MKIALSFGILATLTHVTFAHYMFGHFWVNGTRSEKWQYVRDVAPNPQSPHYGKSDPVLVDQAKIHPLLDIKSPAMTCGLDAFLSANRTQTATVVAGSEVGFEPVHVWSSEVSIYHWGPVTAWLSRAPNDDLEHFDGREGDWFKIEFIGSSDNITWASLGKTGANFTIPKTTPPGKYLLRFEHLRPYSQPNAVEVYLNCAQVEIVGPGGGKPTGFAKFPGTYQWDHPGILIPKEYDYNLYYPGVERGGLFGYQSPGPAVWEG